MKRVRYSIESWKGLGAINPSIVDWADNLKDARYLMKRRSTYKPRQTKNQYCTGRPLEDNLTCNCGECLQHRGLTDIQILKWKVDPQTGMIEPGSDRYVEGLRRNCGGGFNLERVLTLNP